MEPPLSVAEITRDFSAARFFLRTEQKKKPKKKLTIFGNTKQVIQDYDTVFDNSIPFRKNDTTDYVFQNTGRAGPALCALALRPGSII